MYLFGNASIYSIKHECFDLDHQIDFDFLEFLIENTNTTIAFNGTDPIEVRIPKHMNIQVKETDPGEKGNTAQGGSKRAVLETGISIQVPLFIQIGDTIRVDTKEKRYIERIKISHVQ